MTTWHTEPVVAHTSDSCHLITFLVQCKN